MGRRRARIGRAGTLCGVLLLAEPGTALGQRTRDQGRLTVGVGLLHASGGGRLWQTPTQPIISNTGTDTIALERHLTSGLGAAVSLAYFPNAYIGVSGEVVILRLGAIDLCRLVQSTGDTFTTSLCANLNNVEYSSSSATFSAGVILRPGLRGAVQPYVRLMGGFTTVENSFVRVTGVAQSPQGMPLVTVYRDDRTTTISSYLTAGVGFAAPLSPGWQFRCEVRQSYLQIPAVSGPTPYQGVEPATGRRGVHLFNFTAGVDVVLERKRGRAY